VPVHPAKEVLPSSDSPSFEYPGIRAHAPHRRQIESQRPSRTGLCTPPLNFSVYRTAAEINVRSQNSFPWGFSAIKTAQAVADWNGVGVAAPYWPEIFSASRFLPARNAYSSLRAFAINDNGADTPPLFPCWKFLDPPLCMGAWTTKQRNLRLMAQPELVVGWVHPWVGLGPKFGNPVWVGLGFVLDMIDFLDFVILVIKGTFPPWVELSRMRDHNCLLAKLKLSNCLNGV